MSSSSKEVTKFKDVFTNVELFSTDHSGLFVPGRLNSSAATNGEDDQSAAFLPESRFFRLKRILWGAQRRLPAFTMTGREVLAGLVEIPRSPDQTHAIVTVPVDLRNSVQTQVPMNLAEITERRGDDQAKAIAAHGVYAVLMGNEDMPRIDASNE